MVNKIKKRRCAYHSTSRDLSEYSFWVTDRRWKNPVDVYECKLCKERLDRDIERSEKIRSHNKKQNEEASRERNILWEKKSAKRIKSISEDIWDFVVQDYLCKDLKLKWPLKHVYKESIPKEILQLTRSHMRLQRLIDDMKKSMRNVQSIESEKERQSKLNKPLMNCRLHGKLFKDDIIKGGKSRWTGDQRYKCKRCMRDLHRDYYLRKKEYVSNKCADYRKTNPEKVKETKKKSKEKCNGKNSEHETT